MSLAYRTGTIAVANGDTTVTGTLTAWTNNVKQGDLIHLPDGKFYEVSTDPASNTSLTIVEAYAGTTVASGGAYRIYRYSDGWRPTAEINVRLGALLTRFENTTGFILNGTGAPSDSLGEDGDLYIRTDVPKIHTKESGAWDAGVTLGGQTGATGPSYAGTSTTSRSLGTGSMSVTASAGMAFLAGSRVRLASAASPTTHWMEGPVTAYNSTTGSLTFTSDLFLGSGSRADWNISLAGERGATGATGAGYASTSTTSLAIGTGTKAFAGVGTTLGYTVGQRARAASAANTANWMEGRVTGYSGGTLTISVDVVGGSGTFADWSINVAGSQGIQGATGATGATGSTGPSGPSYAATSTTSLAIGTGAKSSTTQTGLAYVVGSRTRMASAANTSNWMEGVCTAYNSGTGAITINVDLVGGSGTFADWNFSLSGNKGEDGVSFAFASAYSGATAYAVNDVVTNQNSTWICIQAGTGNAPPTLPTKTNAYWEALAIAGADGAGSTDSVNGIASVGGNVTLTASDIESALDPTNYSTAGTSINDHLTGIDDALAMAGSDYTVTALASAATVDIGAAATVAVTISGTTTITSLGTVANKYKIVRFLAALTLAHHATSLILPGAANITTAAGDVAYFISDVSGNWRCVNYEPAANSPVKAIRGDSVNAVLSAAEKQVARLNMSAASFDAGAALGLLTNPFFEISQENGSTAGAAATAYYPADQWYAFESSDAVLSVANIANPFSSTATLKRLQNSIKAIATTADASFSSGQYILPCTQVVEGTVWRSLGWGTSDARAVDIVIIAQCSVTGTYPVAITNAAGNRSYTASISLTANTPTVCLVTIPGDTGGTWVTTTAASAKIFIGAAGGSLTHATSLNAWEATDNFSHASCTNWAASGTTDFFEVAYAQAFPAGVLPFTSASQITGEALQLLLSMRRPYSVEMARCKRYWQTNFNPGVSPANNTFTRRCIAHAASTTTILAGFQFEVEMRAAPSMTFYSSNVKATPTAGMWQYYRAGAWTDATGMTAGETGERAFYAFVTGTYTADQAHTMAGGYVANARM